jgi:hypothetical protein
MQSEKKIFSRLVPTVSAWVSQQKVIIATIVAFKPSCLPTNSEIAEQNLVASQKAMAGEQEISTCPLH